ncbi:hypothetical protein BC628DRAFT_1419044 [Trametes gibbosa]|uniref:Zinc finger protein 217 n=1 Tax=Trametes gibbosa TaxID=160864 RepID=A0A6B9KK35_9APHY|nr:hypothetical protein BC628DRAFT_1419044 [Trametes gibbosa]QHA24590.1 zinc finger protein 217 [Trametes gibbosa]
MQSSLLHASQHNFRTNPAAGDASRRVSPAGSYDAHGHGFIDSHGLHHPQSGQSIHPRSSLNHGSFANPASIQPQYHLQDYIGSPSLPAPSLSNSQTRSDRWQSTRPSPPLSSGTPNVHVAYPGALETSRNTRHDSFHSQSGFPTYHHTHGSLSPHYHSALIPSENYDGSFAGAAASSFPASSSYPSAPHSASYSHAVQPGVNHARIARESVPRCQWADCHLRVEDPSPAGIARHLRQYHNVQVTDNRSRHPCVWGEGCGKDMYPSSLGKHIAECHLRNMVKQCPHCGADFARADTLSRHIKAFCPNTSTQ